jgi:hypothetical protein
MISNNKNRAADSISRELFASADLPPTEIEIVEERGYQQGAKRTEQPL